MMSALRPALSLEPLMSLADLSVRHWLSNLRIYNFFFLLTLFPTISLNTLLRRSLLVTERWSILVRFPLAAHQSVFSGLCSGSDETPPIYRQYPVCHTSCSQKLQQKKKYAECLSINLQQDPDSFPFWLSFSLWHPHNFNSLNVSLFHKKEKKEKKPEPFLLTLLLSRWTLSEFTSPSPDRIHGYPELSIKSSP